MPPTQLTVEARQDGDGVTILVCEGELDIATAPDLAYAIGWSITPDLRRLRIDATKVSFCDSTGLRCLLEGAYQCRQRDATLELTAGDRLARTLQLVGLPVLAQDGMLLADLASIVTDTVAAKITTPTPSPAK